ncbi:hypothetical protein ACFL1I_02790 [Candidatus Omnitrophota bacterium]
MADDLILNCDDIRKRLKPFQQDLLAEKEYTAYVAHLDQCAKCKEYIGSIDFLSNQLSKLGDIKVPSDLASTILFKLSQAPEPEAQTAKKFALSEKLILRVIVSVLLAAMLFFGIKYLKGRGRVQEIKDAPAQVQEIKAEEPLSERKREKRFTNEDAVMIYGAEDAPVTTIPEELFVERVEEAQPLHWHFQYAEKGQTATEKTILQLESTLETKLKEIKTHQSAIERLETEIAGLDFKINSFSSDDKTDLQTAKTAASQKLQSQIKLKAQAETALKSSRAEKSRTENILREIKRKEDSRKGELRRILVSAATRFNYQANDIYDFVLESAEIENTLEEILLISGDTATSRLRNLTSTAPILADQEYDVSLYFEKKDASALHWHISLTAEDQKVRLLDAIRGKGGQIDYDSKSLVVFSIQITEVAALKSRIKAMGLGISEFGRTALKKKKLAAGPVTISIYTK